MTTPRLPPCRHRGEMIADGRWECHSPNLILPAGIATDGVCLACPYPATGAILTAVPPSDDAFDCTLVELRDRVAATSDGMPLNWQHWEISRRLHRQLLDEAIASTPDYPAGFSGRGVVIAAGGPLYFRCAYVCVSVLRAVGCTLPIELWHLGEREVNAEMALTVEPLGVRCRDAFDVSPRPRKLGGWELKPFAVIHSRFREVLYLDADNVPAVDPTFLFDEAEYRTHGAVFWPDLPCQDQAPYTSISDIAWDVAGVSHRGGPPFESGQFFIDKERCWSALQATMHLNERSDFWYHYVYGDKDTFKLAWHRLRLGFAMPSRCSSWMWPAIMQHDFSGRLLFAHACQGKRELATGVRIPSLPNADVAACAANRLCTSYDS